MNPAGAAVGIRTTSRTEPLATRPALNWGIGYFLESHREGIREAPHRKRLEPLLSRFEVQIGTVHARCFGAYNLPTTKTQLHRSCGLLPRVLPCDLHFHLTSKW